jgi:hypothetical protein
MIKRWRMIWTGHVACRDKQQNADAILVGKPEGEKSKQTFVASVKAWNMSSAVTKQVRAINTLNAVFLNNLLNMKQHNP